MHTNIQSLCCMPETVILVCTAVKKKKKKQTNKKKFKLKKILQSYGSIKMKQCCPVNQRHREGGPCLQRISLDLEPLLSSQASPSEAQHPGIMALYQAPKLPRPQRCTSTRKQLFLLHFHSLKYSISSVPSLPLATLIFTTDLTILLWPC